jgi:hypothetical protein
MRAIPLLDADAEGIYDAITAAKQSPRSGRMKASRKLVVGSYKEYEAAMPDVGSLTSAKLSKLQKEAMLHAYSVETAPMTELREGLLDRIDVARCAFCGISESSTIDHYLPKESYPEFSIYPNNLIPCCPWCNTKKRNRILIDGTDVRMFLHPCLDKIPAADFISVRARIHGNALLITYRLDRPKGMKKRTFQHLQSHFDELGLADRYRRMGLEHLGSQYLAFKRSYGKRREARKVSEMLRDGAETYEDAYGTNFWLVKLYAALAQSDEFCDGGFAVVRRTG